MSHIEDQSSIPCNITGEDAKTRQAEGRQRGPIELARTFEFGLKRGFWKTQAQAAPSLKISQSQISDSLALNRVPREVLALFEAIDALNFGVAAKLATLSRELGTEEMLARAATVTALPNKLPASRILAVLSGGDIRRTDANGVCRKAVSLPLDIAREYFAGVEARRWKSATKASVHLNHSPTRVTRALQVAALPRDVIGLFSPKSPLTFAAGERLLKLRVALGEDRMIRNAKRLTDRCGHLHSRGIVDALASGEIKNPAGVATRVTIGTGGRSLRIDSDRLDLLIAAKAEIERFLDVIANRADTWAMLKGRRGKADSRK